MSLPVNTIFQIFTDAASGIARARIDNGEELSPYQMAKLGIRLLNTALNAIPIPNPVELVPEKAVVGYVYLVHDGAGAYKIGNTTNLKRRIWNEIQPKYPRALELICHHRTRHYEAIERYWHARFSHKRLNGEWFDLSEEDIEDFKNGL